MKVTLLKSLLYKGIAIIKLGIHNVWLLHPMS